MKKLCFIFLAAVSLTASEARTALGSEAPDRPASSSAGSGTFDRHTRALELHITGLLENDPKKKAALFLEAVTLDPRAKAPLLQLMKILPRVPGYSQEVCKKLDLLRRADPQNLFLTLQYSFVAARSGVSPQENLKVITPLLRKNFSPAENADYYDLAFFWVDLAISSGEPCGSVPFRTDHPRLQLAAFAYYSVCHQRERFFRSGKFAAEMVRKYADLLQKAPVKDRDDCSRRITLFNALKVFDLAYRTAEKWYSQKKDIYAALMFIDVSAKAGKIRQLDALLKAYPVLSKDFCIKKRIEAYLAVGNFSRAYEETVNFSKPLDKITNQLNIAILSKDFSQALKHLEQIKTIPRFNKDVIAFEELRIAEFSKDKKFLASAKKHFGPRISKDPSLANSFAYVSAVLGADLDEAEKLMTFALSADPRNAAFLDSMAWVLYQKKQYKKAAGYIEKAFRFQDHKSGGAVMADHAGDIYLALNQKQKALHCWLLSMELYKESPAANFDLDFSALKKKIADLNAGKYK